jgi:hypothetical protein
MYRLNAGSGFPLKEGRISGAYRVENIDLVKKSSDGKEGAVKFENAFAAERSRDKDSDKLDLRLDLGVEVGAGLLAAFVGTNAIGVFGFITGVGTSKSGWVDTDTAGGDDTFRSYLLGLRNDEPLIGVCGNENDEDSEGSSCSSDGVERIESVDMDREGAIGSSSISSKHGASLSDSNKRSSGEPFVIDSEGRTSFFHSARNRSTDILRGRDLVDSFRLVGGGMAVLASKAATEAGSAVESFDSFDFCLVVASFFDDDMAFFFVGIDTGEDVLVSSLRDFVVVVVVVAAACVVDWLTDNFCTSFGRFLY